MANDHSVVIFVPDAFKANCNEMLAAYYGDASGAQNLSSPASLTGSLPATHWYCHIYRDNVSALALAALPTPTGVGTLPTGLNLTGYSVTAEDAQTAAASIPRVSVKTGSVSPESHVSDILTELGLQSVVVSTLPGQ